VEEVARIVAQIRRQWPWFSAAASQRAWLAALLAALHGFEPWRPSN
jgi:hypothetical protein